MPSRLRTLALALVLAAVGAGAANAAEDHLMVGQPLARFALLKAGTHRYVRYRVEATSAP